MLPIKLNVNCKSTLLISGEYKQKRILQRSLHSSGPQYSQIVIKIRYLQHQPRNQTHHKNKIQYNTCQSRICCPRTNLVAGGVKTPPKVLPTRSKSIRLQVLHCGQQFRQSFAIICYLATHQVEMSSIDCLASKPPVIGGNLMERRFFMIPSVELRS